MSIENTTTSFNRIITDWQNLNQHHDILHDFSYQNMSSRLKKIGMAIHNSAITISGRQGGGGAKDDVIKGKLKEIEESVSLESYYSDLLSTFYGQNEFPSNDEYAKAIKGISTIQNNISHHWYDDGFILFTKRLDQIEINGDNISYPTDYLTTYFVKLKATDGNGSQRYDLRSRGLSHDQESNAYRITDIVDIWNNFMYKETYVELGYLNSKEKVDSLNERQPTPSEDITTSQFRENIASSVGGDPTQV